MGTVPAMRVRPFVPILAVAFAAALTPVSAAVADSGHNGALLFAEDLPTDPAAPTTGSTVTGTVGPDDQIDFYTFTVRGYQQIALDDPEGDGCPEFSLSTESGGMTQHTLQTDDDGETHRIMVRVRYNAYQCGDTLPASGKLPYTFRVRFKERVPSDPLPSLVRESEPNDTEQTAAVAENGVWYRGRVDGLNDPDLYRFWVPPGKHVIFSQVVGMSEADDGWQDTAMLSGMTSPSLDRYLKPHYTPFSFTSQNNRSASYRVVYGPEQVTMRMPGTSDPSSWAFQIAAAPGSMLTAPYDGPPSAPWGAPVEGGTKLGNNTPPPLTNAPIPSAEELLEYYSGYYVPAPATPSAPTPVTGTGGTDGPPPRVPAPVAGAAGGGTAPVASAPVASRPAHAVSDGARCATASRALRVSGSATMSCRGVRSGTRLRVRWTRAGRTASTTTTVRSGKATLAARGRHRGRYAVVVAAGRTVLMRRAVIVR